MSGRPEGGTMRAQPYLEEPSRKMLLRTFIAPQITRLIVERTIEVKMTVGYNNRFISEYGANRGFGRYV